MSVDGSVRGKDQQYFGALVVSGAGITWRNAPIQELRGAITLSGKELQLVNLDLLNGFSRDRYAVNYLKRVGALGIISTHLDPLRHALAIGLYGIQRTFLLDSGAMDTITNQLKNTPVHALEILPAMVAPKMLERVRAISADLPVVVGGLIQTMKEVEELLAQGLSAVSTSNPVMWIK